MAEKCPRPIIVHLLQEYMKCLHVCHRSSYWVPGASPFCRATQCPKVNSNPLQLFVSPASFFLHYGRKTTKYQRLQRNDTLSNAICVFQPDFVPLWFNLSHSSRRWRWQSGTVNLSSYGVSFRRWRLLAWQLPSQITP